MAYLPPTGDSSGVFALLSAVADPEAAKKRLEELSKAKADLDKSLEENRLQAVQVSEDKKAALVAMDQAVLERQSLEDKIAKHEAYVATKEKEFVDKTAETAAFHAQAVSHLQHAQNLNQAADERLSKIIDREQKAEAALIDMTKRQESLSNKESDYHRRIKKLQDILK